MPLVRLMAEQCNKLVGIGINAIHVQSPMEAKQAVSCTSYSHIFSSPELLSTMIDHLNELPADSNLRSRMKFLFVDESHCIVKWGQGGTESKAFRKQYDAIGSIRACLPDTVIVAMTATATKMVVESITKSLHMENFTTIRVTPNRCNIRYSVVKLKCVDIASAFCWLHEHLEQQGENSKRFIIFCRHLKNIAAIHQYLRYHHGPHRVQQYHSKIPKEIQDEIAANFNNPNSQLKIVVCSSSFSMGLDIPAIYNVIHYGMPADIDQYVQESGRVGRDGTSSQACVLYHRHCNVGSSMTDEAKEFVKLKTCRRKYLMDYFAETSDYSYSKAHDCCDVCAARCRCDSDHMSDSFLSLPELYYVQVLNSSSSEDSSS